MEITPAASGATPSVAQTEAYDQSLMGRAVANVAGGIATTADQAVVMDGSAGNLQKAAGTGTGFKLEPAAAAGLAASCRESLDILDGIQIHLAVVSQAPKLGTLPSVADIADFTASVGADPQLGIVQATHSLKATLQQMHDAYLKASTDYQETNNEIADTMRRLGNDGTNTSTNPAPNTTTPPSTSGPNFSA